MPLPRGCSVTIPQVPDAVLWREHIRRRPSPSAVTRKPPSGDADNFLGCQGLGCLPLFISPLSRRNSGFSISAFYSNVLLSSRRELAGQRAGPGFRATGLRPQPLSLSLPGASREHWQTYSEVWTYSEIFKRIDTKCCHTKIHLLSQW